MQPNSKGVTGIYIKTYSKVGEYHKSLGKGNEDNINVYQDERYLFVAISDGAGSCPYAKEAAKSITDYSIPYCKANSTRLFNCGYTQLKEKFRELLKYVRKMFNTTATKIGTNFKNMKGTLVLIMFDLVLGKYITLHIGDGVILEFEKPGLSNYRVISNAQNGIDSRFTYFVNSDDIFNLMRVHKGNIAKHGYLICSDGLYQTRAMSGIIKDGFCLSKHEDDCSFCVVML